MKEIKFGNVSGLDIQLYAAVEHAVEDIVHNYIEKGGAAVAINPEKIMIARGDSVIKDTLADNEIKYADGIGVVKLLSFKTKERIGRVPGCELWEALMKRAGKNGIPVYLVGAKEEVLGRTVDLLKSKYNTNIAGFKDGYFSNEDALIDDILKSKARIVTVALGSPRQEVFIRKCRKAGIKAFFMGVGGTYDVFTGNVTRAPRIFCALGLEWFYRLISQPTRIYRQRNLVKFMILALFGRL